MSIPAETAYLAVGSNEGDRLAHLRAAVRRLKDREAISGVHASPVYEAEAHTLRPEEQQPPYLNAVIMIDTTMTPEMLLDVCQALERAAGRVRDPARRWQPRPPDLDLLVSGRETLRTPRLMLPHPRLGERRFVLRPLVDLDPNLYVPPPFDATARTLLARCPDDAALGRTGYSLLS